jgi:hypothetical protein
MKRMITCLIALTVLFACRKSDDDDKNMTLPEGMYIGTFHRTGMDTASISLTLDGNNYNGQSDIDKYPAICHGSYEFYDNTIRFTDSCSWTANFDWTLILNGPYSLTRDNNEFRFSRTNLNVTDEFILRKVQR